MIKNNKELDNIDKPKEEVIKTKLLPKTPNLTI
jgi:hypothetical protein